MQQISARIEHRLKKAGTLEDYRAREAELQKMVDAQVLTEESASELLEKEYLAEAVEQEEAEKDNPVVPKKMAKPPSVEDCQWVYQNFANKSVEKDHAPSQGAWGLMEQCKKDKTTYKWLLDRLTPKMLAEQDDRKDRKAMDLTGLNKKLVSRFNSKVEALFGGAV